VNAHFVFAHWIARRSARADCVEVIAYPAVRLFASVSVLAAASFHQ
jgi:hypothetical protein